MYVHVVDVLAHAAAAAKHGRRPLQPERPALQLFHLDSGGGGMPEELHRAQVYGPKTEEKKTLTLC